MAPFYQRGLLLACLLTVISVCRADSPLTVSASRGEDIALPCVDSNVTHPKSCSRVRWIKYTTDAGQMRVLLAWPKEIQEPKWEADLLLTNLQKSHEGLYGCEICQGWDCALVQNISLRVKDCKALPAVKVALSRPIELNCPVNTTLGQEGSRNISWALLKGGEPQPINSSRAEMDDTSLVIKSASDSAWYRCTYIYRQTQRCFDIKILVQAEDAVEATPFPVIATKTQEAATMRETLTQSRATVTAVVAPVIVGILVAALIGAFIYRSRNIQRATQQTLGPPAAVCSDGVYDAYETVSLTDGERSDHSSQHDPSGFLHHFTDDSLVDLTDPHRNQTCNSLYQGVQEEGMCTFHY